MARCLRNVLALTLPFLLDGSVVPRRVEPDAEEEDGAEEPVAQHPEYG